MRRDYRPTLPLAQQLRVVGQALEELHVQDFELQVNGRDYLVQGSTATPKREESPAPAQETREGGFGGLRRMFGGQSPKQTEPMPAPASEPTQIELRFTPDDVARLEREGQSKRQDFPGMPDFYTLPQVLRTIGDYLDRQGRKLVRVVKQGPSVTIEYETEAGQRNTEERTTSSLYDLSVRMYLRRSDRS